MGTKIVHFGSLGGPWHPEKASPEKELKKGRCIPVAGVHLETILASFFDDLLVNCLVRFLDHFWNHFGRIPGARMDSKSIKNGFTIQSKFQSDV